MFKFERTYEMMIELKENQYKEISSKENIKDSLIANKAVGFNIKLDDHIIGFARLRK